VPAFSELELDRRLLAVDERRVPRYHFDVLVVGGGAAGAAAAVSAAEAGASTALVCKRDLHESNTHYAQGGVAAVLSDEDSFESHVADTLRVGCGLADPAIADVVVRGGPGAIERLIEHGARFDRTASGELQLSREGGHRSPRIVHAQGDTTGVEIQQTLTRTLAAHPQIRTFPDTFAIDLLQAETGEVVGILARRQSGEPVAFCAEQVILATGGAGQVYRETTNPVIATGDGVSLAFRAGAVVRDLEFFQFHPTCLYIAGAARVLISEIVRGAGGVLRDRTGERFMPAFHADAELAPRDVVSRAVFRRMVATGDTNVYLDLSDVDGDPHELFPTISRICAFFGIDIGRDPVPVRPGAHYMIGGVRVDADGRASVPGLWAVGECASTGLHGANRMGSNSLLEALVLGARAGTAAAEAAERATGARWRPWPEPRSTRSRPGLQVNVEDVTYSLKSLMWRQMGIERSATSLDDALDKIALWSRAVRELAAPEPRTWELLNMLCIAHLSAVGARAREESRGVHFRTDFPEEREEWRVHTELALDADSGVRASVRCTHVPLPAPVTVS